MHIAPIPPERTPGRWDASIDLTPAILPPGCRPSEAIVRNVTTAVCALPGAGLISVETHAAAPATLRWITLYASGSAQPVEGPEWDDRARRIEHAVREVVSGVG